MPSLTQYYAECGGAGGLLDENSGVANYAGNSNTVAITHNLELEPDVITISPILNPGGYIGDYWVTKDATRFYVGNTGSYTGQFRWYARSIHEGAELPAEKFGVGNFLGTGQEVLIAHGFLSTPTQLSITPVGNTNNTLGEVWIRANSTHLMIGNTGSYVGQFMYYARVIG